MVRRLCSVHGSAGSADRWSFNPKTFCQAGYLALAFDLPGHGLASKTLDEPLSVPGYARALAAFLEELTEPAVLVGTSVGAHIAAYWATQIPERVKALVLVSGGGAIPLGPEHRERLRRIATYRSREDGLERLRRCLFDPRLAAGDIVEQEFRLNSSLGAEECLHAFGRYIAEEIDGDVVGEKLRELAARIPSIVVWGADDKILPSSFGLEMQAAIGGSSRFIAIKNSGHAPYFERPWSSIRHCCASWQHWGTNDVRPFSTVTPSACCFPCALIDAITPAKRASEFAIQLCVSQTRTGGMHSCDSSPRALP